MNFTKLCRSDFKISLKPSDILSTMLSENSNPLIKMHPTQFFTVNERNLQLKSEERDLLQEEISGLIVAQLSASPEHRQVSFTMKWCSN